MPPPGRLVRLEITGWVRRYAGLTEAPDELAQRVERTTRAQVQAAAQKLTLDTVYFLKGKE